MLPVRARYITIVVGLLGLSTASCLPFSARTEMVMLGDEAGRAYPVGLIPSTFLGYGIEDENAGQLALELTSVRTRRDFFDAPVVEAAGTSRAQPGTDYVVEITPRLLIVGQRNVDVKVKLTRRGRDLVMRPKKGDLCAFVAHGERAADAAPDWVSSDDDGGLVARINEVTPEMVGWQMLVMCLQDRPASPIPFALRVVPDVRILLTFDDGPSVEPHEYLGLNGQSEYRTSTEKILDVLAEEGIAGAFFVLTSPDRFLLQTHPKAETERGFALLRRMVRDGHVVAAHWGGTYRSQSVLHTRRVHQPAYDYDGDGCIDAVDATGNALETDLLQCVDRISQAYIAEGRGPKVTEFVRPPLWEYRDRNADVRPVYDRLGLKVILTDAKLYDGGYPWSGFTLDSWMNHGIRASMREGHRDVVVTFHDSNPHTARDIEAVIVEIRRQMAKLELDEGTQWTFARTPEQVEEILHDKTRFRGFEPVREKHSVRGEW